MNKMQKLMLAGAAALALLGATDAAQAGYFNPYGNWVSVCVPGYWAQGPLGPFWVPPVCN